MLGRRAFLTRLAALGLTAATLPALDTVRRSYFVGGWAPRPDQMPRLYGDGVHDDAPALQWLIDHDMPWPTGTYSTGLVLTVGSRQTLHGQYSMLVSRSEPAILVPTGTKGAKIFAIAIQTVNTAFQIA